MEQYEKFLTHVRELETYTRIWKRLDFDKQCCAPEGGLICCGEDLAVISARMHDLRCAPEFVEEMEDCLAHREELEPVQQAAVRYYYERYEKEKNLTPEFVLELARIESAAFEGWVRAREKNDYRIFQPHLEKVIQAFRHAVESRDRTYAHVYDGCLADYERNSTVERMDAFFHEMKEKLLPLLAESQKSSPNVSLFQKPVPLDAQRMLSWQILQAMGLEREKTSLIETKHPFTQLMSKGDVRVTTHFYENNFLSNIYTILHEGGHAIHYGNLPGEFYENGIADISIFGMQECISRFYENVIGRSHAFCEWLVPLIRRYYPEETGKITVQQLFEQVNAHSRNPIRMRADEASYCIHILIRYELEKGFMGGEISAAEIPELWKEKYRDYLGIEVRDDREGVLQDVHWVDCIGYFPSYALGSVASAQLFCRMQQDLDVYGAVRENRLYEVTEWLKEHAFHISMTSDVFTWIREVTGSELSVDSFVRYLELK